MRLIVPIAFAHWIGAVVTPLPSNQRPGIGQGAMVGKPEDREREGYVRTWLVSPAACATGPGRVHGNDASEKQSCSPPLFMWTGSECQIPNRAAGAAQVRSGKIEEQADADNCAKTRHSETGQPVRNTTKSGCRPISERRGTERCRSIRNTRLFGSHTATPDKNRMSRFLSGRI